MTTGTQISENVCLYFKSKYLIVVSYLIYTCTYKFTQIVMLEPTVFGINAFYLHEELFNTKLCFHT